MLFLVFKGKLKKSLNKQTQALLVIAHVVFQEFCAWNKREISMLQDIHNILILSSKKAAQLSNSTTCAAFYYLEFAAFFSFLRASRRASNFALSTSDIVLYFGNANI
jgi:hypothetical protein